MLWLTALLVISPLNIVSKRHDAEFVKSAVAAASQLFLCAHVT